MFRVWEKKIFLLLSFLLYFEKAKKPQDSEGFGNLYQSFQWVAFCCVCGVCVVYDVCVGWLVCVGWRMHVMGWWECIERQSRLFRCLCVAPHLVLRKDLLSELTVFRFLHGFWIWVLMLVEHVLVHWAIALADTLPLLVFPLTLRCAVCFNEFAVSS